MSSSDTSASVRLTGRVKWFNNKTGFGFITIVGGNEQFKDASEIFAHHSAIKVSQEQYRYLVEGEYVEFSVSNTASGNHKFQAMDVRGVKGGKLFCETRHEQRSASASASASASSGAAARSEHVRGGDRPARGRQTTRGGSSGGRGEWMLVRKDSSEYRQTNRSRGGGGRVYSSRPSGERQSQHHESTSSSSAPAPAPAPAAAQAPSPTPASPPATTSQPSEVPSTPRPASTRKPKQSKPSS
jgi:cold shock CspA family protein